MTPVVERRTADPMLYTGVERRQMGLDRRVNGGDRREPHPFVRWSAPAGRTVTNPRVILLICAVVNGVAALMTGDDPPHWLPYPYVWTGTAACAALAATFALFRVSRWSVALCGALAVGATGLRGFWLLVACFTESSEERPGLTIGAAIWLGMAAFVYALWLVVIQPWAAATQTLNESPSPPESGR